MATAPHAPLSLVPIGLFVGTFAHGHDASDQHHEIRRGPQVHEVSDDDLVAWLGAHGTDGSADGAPPSRTMLEHELAEQGIAAPTSVIDRLLDWRLLAEVPREGAPAVEFARAHRAVPAMYGLGNSPEVPELYSIGLIGYEVIQVSRPVFELWSWGDVDGDLWSACESFAEQERVAGGTDPELCEPALVLGNFLAALAGLLSAQAVYLDTIPGAPA